MWNWILLAAVLAMLLAPNIVESVRRTRAERDRLMLGAAMRAGGVDVARLSQAQLGLTLAKAVRACRGCYRVDECMRWYGDGGEHGAPPFCPNAAVLEAYADRKPA
jgi:hypothetical protein